MSTLRSVLTRICLATVLAVATTPVYAEDFPVRPVHVIVQTAAGTTRWRGCLTRSYRRSGARRSSSSTKLAPVV